MAKVFDGLKIFSASEYHRRAGIGEEVCAWLAAQPDLEVVEILVRQTSDRTHHCLTFCVFYRVMAAAAESAPPARRARARARRA